MSDRSRAWCAIAVLAVGCSRATASVADPISPAPPPALDIVAAPHASASVTASTKRPLRQLAPAPSGARVLDIDAVVATLESLSVAHEGRRASALLHDWGFSDAELASVATSVRLDHERLEGNLDGDAELETVLLVRVSLSATTSSVDAFAAVLDPSVDGGVVIGTRKWALSACSVAPSIALRLETVHSLAVMDLVAEWETIPPCDGHAGSVGLDVLTTERGKLEAIATLHDDFSFTAHSGRELDLRRDFAFDDHMPRALLVREHGQEVQRLTFDPARFAYR
ncbi:MAG: hypothetical protein ACHREM_19815 [Polyangiales bacterium]